MAPKKQLHQINTSLTTRELDKLEEGTGNIYKSISIIAKRSRQISNKLKEELSSKLSEFASSVDNLEEIFENREQIEISKYYERLPKPTLLAIEEFLEGKIYYRENKDLE
jgi:DNA-directed RNA polymerase subunit K/omega